MAKMEHVVTCLNGREKVTVFIVRDGGFQRFWWAVKGSCTVHLTSGRPFKSGKQLDNVSDMDVFTCYGEDSAHSDSINDMDTLKWFLRDK